MVMKYLRNRVETSKIEQAERTNLPDWVSDRNASAKAWRCTEELKLEKQLYIKRHNSQTDFLVKKNYQIKGAEVARAVGMNRTVLMNTSTYAERFRQYLADVNGELEEEKNARLKRAENPTAGGVQRSRKQDLVDRIKKDEETIAELEQRICEGFDEIFDKLPLPVKKKLGIS
ncbi:hypothetical protein [Marinobacter xestospongiae]|uniref:Terminase small subunit n=1 Tax=Marinobacter xestospongiae TaxID=994319 RepID=A0ABU3W1G7_9GAMM|nr:hypothetical protein [Marinobacter xestospongiae]MDV2080382.1 hypothetical protein [Marinobacter xestospongiae]